MLKRYISANQLTSFWILSVILAVAVIPFGLLFQSDISRSIKDIIEISNEPFRSNIAVTLPLALQVEKGWAVIIFMMAQAATPTISAIVITLLVATRSGLREFFLRFKPWQDGIGWKRGTAIWMTAILCVLIVKFCSGALHNYLNEEDIWPHFEWNISFSSGLLFILVTSLFFDGGGLLEEGGWRAFALPRLLDRMNATRAAIVLGVLWSLWHIPVKVGMLGIGVEKLLLFYAAFTISCILYTIVITFFFNKLGGSALIGIALHGLMNDSAQVSGNIGDASFPADLASIMVSNSCFLVLVLILLAVGGVELGGKVKSKSELG